MKKDQSLPPLPPLKKFGLVILKQDNERFLVNDLTLSVKRENANELGQKKLVNEVQVIFDLTDMNGRKRRAEGEILPDFFWNLNEALEETRLRQYVLLDFDEGSWKMCPIDEKLLEMKPLLRKFLRFQSEQDSTTKNDSS